MTRMLQAMRWRRAERVTRRYYAAADGPARSGVAQFLSTPRPAVSRQVRTHTR